MKFIVSAASFLALVGSAFAQTEGFDGISAPTKDEDLTAGQTYSITWDPTSSYDGQTVTIRLMQGADMNTLDFGPDVVCMFLRLSSSVGSFFFHLLITINNSGH